MTMLPKHIVDAVGAALDGPCGVPRGAPIAAACSGGADSVALVGALSALSSTWPLVEVLYVDHGLRKAPEECEAARNAATCAAVDFTAVPLDLEAGPNLQARAREARYGALLAAARQEAFIATGHTLTDQAETILQRLMRGAGTRGLQGVHWSHGRIVRPMLGIDRATIRALGLPFADDPTNATGAYQRNRVRQRILEVMRDECPEIEGALARVAAQAVGERALLRACLARTPLSAAELCKGSAALREAWVRATWPDGVASSRATVECLADALGRGVDCGPIRVDTETVIQLTGGRLEATKRPDPRLRVVAPGPGAYGLGEAWLLIGQGPFEQQPPDDLVEDKLLARTWIQSRVITWPLTLQQLPKPHRPTGERRGTGVRFRLSDGSGTVLWESGQGGAPRAPGRDLPVVLFTL